MDPFEKKSNKIVLTIPFRVGVDFIEVRVRVWDGKHCRLVKGGDNINKDNYDEIVWP